jgi:hypothetical protein
VFHSYSAQHTTQTCCTDSHECDTEVIDGTPATILPCLSCTFHLSEHPFCEPHGAA